MHIGNAKALLISVSLDFISKWIHKRTGRTEYVYLEESPEPDFDTRSSAYRKSEKQEKLEKREKRETERRPWGMKKKVAVSIVCAFATLLLGAGAYAYTIFQDPMAQFDNVAEQFALPTSTQTQALTPAAPASGSATQSAEPSPDEYDELVASADFSLLKNIVNVMLIGVDHSTERETWSGKKAFHADVMIVLAINTDTGTVDMISLPRDTYAKIPGVKGIYKLNASIDCGGGWPTEGGFNKVCEAASWMLGGIPVQYYYAVDMNAVKDLANAIGGIDFSLPGLAVADFGSLGDQLLGDTTKHTTMTAEVVDELPKPRRRTAPAYPDKARQRGITGYVKLKILLGANGEIGRVRVVEAKPRGVFEEAALAAVRQWEFEPAVYQGSPVETWMDQVVRFELN